MIYKREVDTSQTSHPYFKYIHIWHLFHQCQSLNEYLFSTYCGHSFLPGMEETIMCMHVHAPPHRIRV